MEDLEKDGTGTPAGPGENEPENARPVYNETPEAGLPAEPYRGIKPFRYADRKIFSARDWEIEQLLNLILLYRGSLLYGQSGIGKSSLINAGLVPLLEENKLQPNIIRVYPNHKQTFRVYKINNADKDETFLPTLFDSFSSSASNEISIGVSLEDFKATLAKQTYNNAEGTDLAIPVLIFDQFEELITLFEEAGKIAVTQDDIPVAERRTFQEELISFFKACYYEKDLRVKFLFSFREDYLAKFSKLFRAIPDLRDHSLRVKAIDKEDMEEIIGCPFTTADPDKLAYQNPFDEELIDLLTGNLLEYFGEQDAVLTDVQVVCQYVYETETDKRTELFLLDGAPKKDCIDNIIQLFYARLLEKLPADDKPLAIAILSLLVLNEHTRNIYHTDAIVDELNDVYAPEAVNRVLRILDDETRLIRSEVRSGSNKAYYEINSESLIPYINSLKLKREEELKQLEIKRKEEAKQQEIKDQEEAKRLKLANDLKIEQDRARDFKEQMQRAVERSGRLKKAIIVIILVVLLAVLWFLYQQVGIASKNKSQTYLMAAKNAGNASLAYAIASARLGKDKSNDKLKQYADRLVLNHNLISRVLYYPDELVAGFFKGTDTIGVVGKSSVNYFSKSGLLLKQQFFNKILYADTKQGYIIINTNNLLATFDATKVNINQLCLLNGHVLTSFISPQNPQVFAISPNGSWFLVDNQLYKTGKPDKYKTIQFPSFGNGLSAAIFTPDSKYIITGFMSGHIIVYNLNGVRVNTFEDSRNYQAVTALAVTSDLKYLIVGGQNNTLRFFNLPINTEKNPLKNSDVITRDPVGTKRLAERNGVGQINQIVISRGSKNFLALSENNTTTLWDFKGNKIGDLAGDGNSVSGDFSKDSKSFLTCSSNGRLFLWRNDSLQSIDVAIFSPLNYKLLGLEDYDKENYNINKIYANLDTPDGRLTAILNYSGWLSAAWANQGHDDDENKEILTTSLKELSGLYNTALISDNLKQLSVLNRKILFNSYAQYKDDSLKLTQNYRLDVKSQLDQMFNKMKLQSMALLTDTVDIQQAVLFIYRYKQMGNLYVNSTKSDYKQAIASLKTGISIAEAFERKYPQNNLLKDNIKDNLAVSYGDLAWYSLFVNDHDTAIAAAAKGVIFGKKYDWIYTNLALGYLFKGEFEKARKVYTDFKDQTQANGAGPFNLQFLKDFSDLTAAGVIKPTDKRLTRQIAEIKNILTRPSRKKKLN